MKICTFLCNNSWRGLKRVFIGKKLLASLCLIVFTVAGTLAQTAPDNAAFYLIGTMNGWSTITEAEAANYQYKLTDPDNDGVYTGSFFIPKGEVEFKVFSTPGTWESASYFGTMNGEIYVFNQDIGTTYSYITLYEGYYSSNLKIGNWMGGTMTISIKWEQVYSGAYLPVICALKGSGQPDIPQDPNIYLVGDFNDWRLPDATSDNGALKTDYFSEGSSLYGQILMINKDFEAGNIQVALCKYNKDANEYEFVKPDSFYDCPFTLYRLSNVYPSYLLSGQWSTSSNPQDFAMKINDWQSGTIHIELLKEYSGYIGTSFYGLTDVITEFPSDMYIILDYDGTRERIPVSNLAANYFEASANCSGKDVTIFFTSENSWDPSPENCWGLDKSIADYGLDSTDSRGTLFLVKGGTPISYNFKNSGNLYVNANFSTSQALVSLTFKDNQGMYVVGEVEKDGVANNWLQPSEENADFYNQYFRLEETSSGVFEGTYYIPARGNDLPNFRFYSALTGWDGGASIGSAWDDFTYYELDLSSGPAVSNYVDGGKGCWCPVLGTSWQDNYVKMIVDTNNQTLTLEVVDDSSGSIADIKYDSDSTECWYNLQGVKVERPQSGFYIHVKDGKSSVRFVK